MDRKSYIVLHKSEWDRINRRNHLEQQESDKRDEYFKQLIEKSQNWMKTWPDTVQGQVEKAAKENERKIKRNEDFLKAFRERKKEKTNLKEIKKAKQLIFKNSCYGRQLLSALYESKALEEREVQIKFQAKLQEEARKRDEELAKSETFYKTFDKQDADTELKKRQLAKEMADINKCMHLMKMMEDAKQKSEIKKEDLENAELNKILLDSEAKQTKAYEEFLRRDIKDHEKQQKERNAQRDEREKLEDAIATVQQKKLEKRNYKIKQVIKELHKDKRHTEESRKNYKLVEQLQVEENSRYERFLENGIKRQEEKSIHKEREELLNQKQKREVRCAIAQENKKTADALCICRIFNKCICDRQTIICRTTGKHGKTMEESGKNKEKCFPKKSEEKSTASFLPPRNKLLEQLKKREKEPSPWTGLTAAHDNFAQQAANTLKECRYKIFARKVVDEYRKVNCLDAKTLPVDNYY